MASAGTRSIHLPRNFKSVSFGRRSMLVSDLGIARRADVLHRLAHAILHDGFASWVRRDFGFAPLQSHGRRVSRAVARTRPTSAHRDLARGMHRRPTGVQGPLARLPDVAGHTDVAFRVGRSVGHRSKGAKTARQACS